MQINKQPLNALLIGRDYHLSWALPQLLARAGFQVDAISSSPILNCCKFIRNCQLIPARQSVLSAITDTMRKQHYDWIILTEDCLLAEVLQSNLPLATKLQVLPVQKEENFIHLYSKIGLSKTLFSAGVCTPAFSIAHNLEEVLSSADQVGYPFLVKRDSSGGGNGVFEINTAADVRLLNLKIWDKPVLVQKKISGIELDLSALYFEGKLVHFNYAKVEKQCWKFGISSLRTYHSLHTVDEQISHELEDLGQALGAHGFVNIACILSEGRRFYFEADMRPTVWVEFPRFFGEDPALRIQKWFFHKETLSYPVLAPPNQPSQILLPYFLRLKRRDLLFNRYGVWKFIPRDDPSLIIRLLANRLFSLRIKIHLITFIKWAVPRRYHENLRTLRSRILEIWPLRT